ncbi:MAG: transposase [Actinomycetia bacterium]|nr:transposase [Actinomycetes bacterium]
MRRTRRSFTAEFKADAVVLVIEDGRSIRSVARVSGLVSRVWGTGSARPGSMPANAKA